MYCDFFGLRCRPFEDRADTEFFYPTPDHEEALASIEYEARYGHGMALLIGEPGTGKTLLIRVLLRKLTTSDRAVVLTWPASGQGNLIRETCKGFGISLPSSHPSARLATRLDRYLKRSHRSGHRSVLIIDQAENLTAQNLAELETLTETQRDGESPLSIILAAAPRFRDLLDGAENGRLRQKLFGERDLRPLNIQQTGAFIAHRLRIAGAGDRKLIDPDAVALIFEASRGIPRLINRIGDAALVAAYGAGNLVVRRGDVVDAAASEGGVERSVDLSQLGLERPEQPLAGWPTERIADPLETPRSNRTGSVVDRNEEWGEPYIDPRRVPDDAESEERSTPVTASGPEAQAPDPYSTASGHAPALQQQRRRHADGLESLITRLTRATARAERATATTEASVAQHQAIERHLTSLTADAARLTGRLSETARKATTSLDAVEQRVAAIGRASEETVTGVEARVDTATAAARELREQLEAVNDACRKAGRVQSQLTAFADELADKGDGVQEKVSRLMAGVESSDVARRSLAELLDRVTTTAAGAAEGFKRSQAEMEKRIETLAGTEDRLAREIERRVAAGRESIEAMLQRAAEVAGNANRAVTAVEEKFNTKMAQLERLIEDRLAQAIESCNQQIDTNLTQFESRTEVLDQRTTGIAATIDTLLSSIDAASERAAAVEESIAETGTAVDRIVGRAESAQEGLARITPDAEKLVDRAQAVRGQLETLQHSASNTLVDVGRAHEKLAAIASQTHESRVMVEQMSAGRNACDSTLQLLEERARAVQRLLERAAEADAKQTEQARAVEARLGEARTALDRLAQTSAAAESAREAVASAVQRAEALAGATDDGCTRLSDIVASGRELGEQLDEVIVTGTQIQESLQGMIAHADEKVAQLDSHHAAASATARRLSEETTVGRQVIDALVDSRREAGEVVQRAERIGVDVAEAASNAETQLGNLIDAAASAGAATTETHQAREDAERAFGRLGELTTRAEQRLGELGERQSEAERLAERIGEVTVIMRSAELSQQSIESAQQAAAETLAGLARSNKEAAGRQEQLAALAETVQRAQEVSLASAREADEAAAKLEANLGAMEKALACGGPLLEDFVNQTRGLEQLLVGLDSRCAEIETRLTTSTEKPAEIVAAAQAQSAQLERVCTAVRKLFSGLSTTTLEARKQINEARAASESASKRLIQLTTATDKASGTLREWVREAVRVQARLEGALDKAPSISQTHPGETLRAMSRLGGRNLDWAGTGDGDSEGASFSTVESRLRTGGTRIGQASTGAVPTRAEDVVRLIEDARRAASVAAE